MSFLSRKGSTFAALRLSLLALSASFDSSVPMLLFMMRDVSGADIISLSKALTIFSIVTVGSRRTRNVGGSDLYISRYTFTISSCLKRVGVLEMCRSVCVLSG